MLNHMHRHLRLILLYGWHTSVEPEPAGAARPPEAVPSPPPAVVAVPPRVSSGRAMGTSRCSETPWCCAASTSPPEVVHLAGEPPPPLKAAGAHGPASSGHLETSRGHLRVRAWPRLPRALPLPSPAARRAQRPTGVLPPLLCRREEEEADTPPSLCLCLSNWRAGPAWPWAPRVGLRGGWVGYTFGYT
jgi:hypothetical protein